MDVRHDNQDLGRLESDPNYSGGWDRAIVRSFRKVMNLIRGVADERGLAQWRSLRTEKLKGARSHQWSLRLNDQWRLIYEIEKREGGRNLFVTKGIEDYH